MKFKLLLAASAAACVALPAASLADPPNDQGHGGRDREHTDDKGAKPAKNGRAKRN